MHGLAQLPATVARLVRNRHQTTIKSRGRVERLSLPASVTRQVRPRLMATPRSESATTQWRKKTIPGSAGTVLPENSIGRSIQLGLKVVPKEYPHAAEGGFSAPARPTRAARGR